VKPREWSEKAAKLLDEWGSCMADIKDKNWRVKDHCLSCDTTVQSLCRRTYALWKARPK